jgi:hypothetical protein
MCSFATSCNTFLCFLCFRFVILKFLILYYVYIEFKCQFFRHNFLMHNTVTCRCDYRRAFDRIIGFINIWLPQLGTADNTALSLIYILSRVGCMSRDKWIHAVLDLANLLHIRSYIHTIYNLTITAIGSITITYPVVTAMYSIHLNS